MATAAAADEDIGLCCLCDDCYLATHNRGDFFIDENGLTRNKLALEMADPENESIKGNSACRRLQNAFRKSCCDPNFQPPEVTQAPTSAPVVNISFGNEPLCNVCEHANLPGLPKTVTAVLYIDGNPTCEQLYYMGLRGLIEDCLCIPLQDYLVEGCGCGVYDPKYAVNMMLLGPPTAPPTIAPTTSSPTVRPTRQPTSNPTSTPTEMPTMQPTISPTTAPTNASSLSPLGTLTDSPTRAATEHPIAATAQPSTTRPTTSTSLQNSTIPDNVLAVAYRRKSKPAQTSKDDKAYKLGDGRVRGSA